MYTLDALTGEVRWQFETPNTEVSDAVVSDGLIYFSDCNHEIPRQECNLYALEAETGTTLWRYTANATLLSTPVLGHNVIYIFLSGNLLALQANG